MFLSSKVELNDRVKGYSVGASDYIIKPFNTEELMARIKVLYEYRQQCEKLKFDVAKAPRYRRNGLGRVWGYGAYC